MGGDGSGPGEARRTSDGGNPGSEGDGIWNEATLAEGTTGSHTPRPHTSILGCCPLDVAKGWPAPTPGGVGGTGVKLVKEGPIGGAIGDGWRRVPGGHWRRERAHGGGGGDPVGRVAQDSCCVQKLIANSGVLKITKYLIDKDRSGSKKNTNAFAINCQGKCGYD